MTTALTAKKSFVLYSDLHDSVSEMADEEAGILFKSILVFHATETKPELPARLHFLWLHLLAQFKRDSIKYRATCASRSIAGTKGAKQKLANAGKRKQMKQTLANLADNDNDNDNENDMNTIPPSPRRGESVNQEEHEWSLELSRKLRDETEKKAGQKLTSKAESGSFIKLLRRGITRDQVEKAVDFVIENYGREYFPVICGSVSFVKKWDALVTAKKRMCKKEVKELTEEDCVL